MEKKLLNSDEEYFQYCVDNNIGTVHRKYDSQHSYVGDSDSSEPCEFHHTYTYESGHTETLNVSGKPKKYPCILCWTCEEGDHDYYLGEFVYPEDFSEQQAE